VCRNEIYSVSEKDEPKNQVAPQIGSLQGVLAAVQIIGNYIFPIILQILLYSSPTHGLTNKFT